MSILQAHLRLKFHTTGCGQKHLLPRPQQKGPTAHDTLLRAHASAGPSQRINVILAANAYACNHLPAGLNSHAASAQGQQCGADQKTHKQGRSSVVRARHPQAFQPWQLG